MCFRKEKGLAGLLLILLIICRNSVLKGGAGECGEDVLGDEILENFNGKGLRYWVERVSFPTGIVEVRWMEREFLVTK